MKDSVFLNRTYWQGLFSILLLWPFLISCNILQLTYSTADWVLLWKLDGYFALSNSQEAYLDRQIKEIHNWHRYQQLPHYVQFLKRLDQFWANGLNQTELEIIFTSLENFRVHLAKQAALPGATFLATVTPAQICHFEEVLEQDHQHLLSQNGNASRVRREKRIAATLETLTSWLGELSSDQKIYISQRIEEVPDTTDRWLVHRRNRQIMLLNLLRSSHDPHNLDQSLYRWLADSKTGATPEYLVVSRKWREGVEQVILEIDQILTPDQRTHFSRKLQRLIQDIQGLIGKDTKKHL